MTGQEMPKYQCHKIVWALKIKSIVFDEIEEKQIAADCEFATITPEEEGYGPFKVNFDYCQKHNPKAGGYYVVYEDGYKSFSTASAFESGYVRLTNDPETIKKAPTTFIDLLIVEKSQLEERLKKLVAFIGTPKYNLLTDQERMLILDQKDTMWAYYRILNERISIELGPNEKPVLKLHAPSRYPLAECLAELKFGRPAGDQIFLQECIESYEFATDSDDNYKQQE